MENFGKKLLLTAECVCSCLYSDCIVALLRTLFFFDNMQNVHNGYERETLMRFMKAREGNISDAHNMVCCSTLFLLMLLLLSITLKLVDLFSAYWLFKLEDTKWNWWHTGGEFWDHFLNRYYIVPFSLYVYHYILYLVTISHWTY